MLLIRILLRLNVTRVVPACRVRRITMFAMLLVLVVLRQFSNRMPFTGTKAHCKGDSKKRTNEAFHGARESSEPGRLAKCFVQALPAGSAEAAAGRGRFVDYDFGESA